MFTNGQYSRQAQLVQQNEAAIVPENTLIAYEPKGQEFIQFCELVYGLTGNNVVPVVTVTEEKVFAFLFFQAFRPQRKRGRKRKQREEDEIHEQTIETPVQFDKEEFDRVILY